MSHLANDLHPEQMAELARGFNEHAAVKVILRDHAGISRFFGGLELADPGVAQISKWRPHPDVEAGTRHPVGRGRAETGVTGNTSGDPYHG